MIVPMLHVAALLVALQAPPAERLPETYAHPFYGYKIRMPRGWTRVPNHGKADCSFQGPKAEGYVPRVDMYVKVRDAEVEGAARSLKDTFLKQYPDCVVEADDVSKVRGRDAHHFRLKFTDGGIPMLALWTLVGMPGRVTMLGWACPAAGGARYAAPIEAMMRSLRLYDLPVLDAPQREAATKAYQAGEKAYLAADYKEAAARFREAAALLARYPEVHATLGIALLRQKDFAGAEAAFRKAIEIDPEDGDHYYNFGSTLLQQSKDKEAAAALEKAVKFEPGFEPAWTNLGVARMGAGDLPGAVTALKLAVQADPESAAARFNLGNAYERSGSRELAVAQWKECLKLDPKHGPAQEALERAGAR